MNTASDAKFGLDVYNSIRARGFLHLLTNQLDYAGIQRLKRGNRAEVAKLFLCFGYATVQAAKNLSADEFACWLVQQSSSRANGAAFPVMIMMMCM